MTGRFETRLRIFADKAMANVDLVFRKATFEIYSRVIMRTPVDTGRARGNWQTAADAYPTGVTLTDDKGSVNQSGRGNSVAKSAMESTVLSGPYQRKFVLLNNVPYIGVLEYGRESGAPGSMQAPAGMVRVTIAEFQALVEKAGGEVIRNN